VWLSKFSEKILNSETMQAIKLPNPDLAFIDDRKLLSYSLNYEHIEGKHKARVFESALGINQSNYLVLKEAIYEAVFSNFAVVEKENSFGQLYRLDFSMTYGGKSATIRTGWVCLEGENFVRLTTCFIKT
jgi:hypothetical protein